MKATICIILFSLITHVSLSQELTGDWKGALSVQGNQLRIVFHVTKTGNEYEATMDSIDQNANGTKVTTTTFSFPNIKFEIAGLGAFYEGIMTDKGITGKWVQSGTALFLTLLKIQDFPVGKEK